MSLIYTPIYCMQSSVNLPRIMRKVARFRLVQLLALLRGEGEGSRTSSKKHVKKLHSILRYAESSRRFTEIE